jgi:large subunit ribosomal protein L24
MAMATTPQSERALKLVSLPRICKFRKGDKLQLMVGKKAGAVGSLTKILSKKGRLLIEGVNKVIKHARPDPSDPSKPSGRIEVEASVHVSNVALVCPKCAKPTKVGWKILDTPRLTKDGREKVNKVRICRKCHERIDEDR